jgi:hypothetical protein
MTQVLIRAVASLSFQFRVPNVGTEEEVAVEANTLTMLRAALLAAANAAGVEEGMQFGQSSVSIGAIEALPNSAGQPVTPHLNSVISIHEHATTRLQ